jgi:hypothetical protein
MPNKGNRMTELGRLFFVLRLKHRGNEQKASIELVENPYFTVYPYEKQGLIITPEIAAFRKNWLGSKVK